MWIRSRISFFASHLQQVNRIFLYMGIRRNF
jgi:hypothetical protein